MRYENLCINCMKEKDSADGICPHCGFDSSNYHASEYQLPLHTVLSDNRYIVGKAIGAGGFGITYIAFDTRLNVPVAIKELFVTSKVRRENGRTVLMNTTESGIRQYEEIKRRFMQEARTMAELENVDGVVKVKDYFQQNDTAYIVMEYLDGMTLKEMLQAKKKRLPLEEVMALLKPVMDSLAKMHKAGIVHRDISLDNIMITKDGRVKLIDLGGEKRLGDFDDEDKTVAIKKSVYTPIEQILGKSSNIGPWTDIYALAVTIYRCICGRFPKEAGDRANDKDIEKPGKLGVNISKKQEETLLKALALDKKDRIQTIEQLQSGLSGQKKKSKLPVVLVVLAAAAAAGGGGYFFLQSQQTTALEGGTYVIASYQNPDLVLEVPDNFYESGTSLVLGMTDSSNAQKFYVKEKDKKSYYISAVCSDHSVTAEKAEGSDTEDLVQATFDKTLDKEQSWYFENAGKGTYYIKSGDDKYISCEEDKVAEKANVEMSDDKGAESAKWVLISTRLNESDEVTPVKGMNIEKADGTYQLIPISNEAQRVTVNEGVWSVQDEKQVVEQKVFLSNTEEGAKIISCLDEQGLADTTDTWKFVFVRRGSYYIQNQDGEVLTLNPNDGTLSVENVNEKDDTYQRWYIEETELGKLEQLYSSLNENETYHIENVADNQLWMSARGDSVQQGTLIQLTEKQTMQSQEFSFQKMDNQKYEIVNNYSGKLVTAVPEVDDSARLMDANDSEGQIWSFEEGSDGYYLKSENGYYLGADLERGISVLSEQKEETDQFQWNITEITE